MLPEVLKKSSSLLNAPVHRFQTYCTESIRSNFFPARSWRYPSHCSRRRRRCL